MADHWIILIGLVLWMAVGMITLALLVNATGLPYTKRDLCWCAGLGPIGLIATAVIVLILKAYGYDGYSVDPKSRWIRK